MLQKVDAQHDTQTYPFDCAQGRLLASFARLGIIRLNQCLQFRTKEPSLQCYLETALGGWYAQTFQNSADRQMLSGASRSPSIYNWMQK